jgi:hypothetical protein
MSNKFWPKASYYSLLIFVNLTVFVIVGYAFNLRLYAIGILGPLLFWPAFSLLIEETKYGKKIKRRWFGFPKNVHKGITLFCLLWSGYLIVKAVLPLIKKDYDEVK